MSNSNWCTIESDPGVFTELIAELGVEDVQVEELYSLHAEQMQHLRPIFGLIFLFKWRANEEDGRSPVQNDNVFFAQQVINNACATQAILSILLNAKDIKRGSILDEFKSFTRDFAPEMKGLAISNCEPIRVAHNSFARPDPFIAIERAAKESDDVYHFISYTPVDGVLYELDGLKAGPISLGECTDGNWLDKVRPVIQQRIERYSGSEIRFNLLAVIKNRRSIYIEKLQQMDLQKTKILHKLQSDEMDYDAPGEELPSNHEELASLLSILEQEIPDYQQRVSVEEEKFSAWKTENVRRKHNYIPFLINMLKILAEKDQLQPLIDKAREREKEKKSKII